MAAETCGDEEEEADTYVHVHGRTHTHTHAHIYTRAHSRTHIYTRTHSSTTGEGKKPSDMDDPLTKWLHLHSNINNTAGTDAVDSSEW